MLSLPAPLKPTAAIAAAAATAATFLPCGLGLRPIGRLLQGLGLFFLMPRRPRGRIRTGDADAAQNQF